MGRTIRVFVANRPGAAGITGWAQVNGFRGDTSISKRVQYDLYYLRHWSIGFDLQIILLTRPAVKPRTSGRGYKAMFLFPSG